MAGTRLVASPPCGTCSILVALPDFERARQKTERVGGWAEPVHLTGRSTTVDNTREVLRSYTSSDEPVSSLLTTCGNRRSSPLSACSRLYAADTYRLIRAGQFDGKNAPDTVRTTPVPSPPSPPFPATLYTTAPQRLAATSRPAATAPCGGPTQYAAEPRDIRRGHGLVQRPYLRPVGALHHLPAL
ncbi:replication initiator [Streptomyces lushanensis]|uniref:replication initiator n=1 Tax=Streptomyces lushanensis TaxID=1434255 RepID=UPI00316ABD2F